MLRSIQDEAADKLDELVTLEEVEVELPGGVMLETLFSSRVGSKIITTLFMSPAIGFHALELAQRLGGEL
jgi:hypothetical protein